jgi:acetoin utilization protein AcuB
MNTPVSDIMTPDPVSLHPSDSMLTVKELFHNHRFNHLPVVNSEHELVGMISKSDFYHLTMGIVHNKEEDEAENELLKGVKVEDIMIKGIAKIDPTDTIGVATEIFLENLFHALPIVDGKKLIGIVTCFDILKHQFKLAYPTQDI